MVSLLTSATARSAKTSMPSAVDILTAPSTWNFSSVPFQRAFSERSFMPFSVEASKGPEKVAILVVAS